MTVSNTYADSSVQRNVLNELLERGEGLVGPGNDSTPGRGILNSSGPVPVSTIVSYTDHLQRLTGSLNKVGPSGSFSQAELSDLEVLIAAVLDKMQAAQESISKNKINLTTEKQRGVHTETEATRAEVEEKQEEAKKKQEGMSIWQKISLAFQWIATALTFIVGAILTAIPATQALGVLMLAAGAVQLAMVIDATVQMATGKSIVAHTAEAVLSSIERDFNITIDPAVKDKLVMAADIYAKVNGAAIAIALSIGMMLIPGGQAGAIASVVQAVSGIVGTTMQIVNTAGSLAAAGVGYSASQDIADAKSLEADSQELSAFVQLLSNVIDQLIEILKKAGDTFNNAIEDTLGSMNERSAAAGRVQFAG